MSWQDGREYKLDQQLDLRSTVHDKIAAQTVKIFERRTKWRQSRMRTYAKLCKIEANASAPRRLSRFLPSVRVPPFADGQASLTSSAETRV